MRFLSHGLLLFVFTALVLAVCPAMAEEVPSEEPEAIQALSPLEKRATLRAFEQLNLRLETAPENKKIGSIHVFTVDPFDEKESFLSFLNYVHWTTKDHVVIREILLAPGDSFDADLLGESERLLRNAALRSLVVVLPVQKEDSPEKDTVDLLIVTRDIWSLRVNTLFEAVGDNLDYLYLNLAENNLLGLNKSAALTFLLQDDTFDVGGLYTDPRLMGSRHMLSVNQSAVFNKNDGAYEGLKGGFSFGLPLYKPSQKWGYSVSGSYASYMARRYDDNGVMTWLYEDPDSGESKTLEHRFEYLNVSSSVLATRSFGNVFKKDISFGYGFRLTDASLTDDFDAPDYVEDLFVDLIFPREEISSYLVGRFRFYTRRYTRLYNYNTFGLAEDFRIGPSFSLTANLASSLIGSDRDYLNLSTSLSWSFVPRRGLLFWLGTSLSTEVDDDLLMRNRKVTGNVGLISPTLFGIGRFVLGGRFAMQFDTTYYSQYQLGGNNALRGIGTRALMGKNYFRANGEFRSSALSLGFLSIGGVLFYDAGATFDEETPTVHQAVGAGLRILILAVNRQVIRIDYGVPVTGDQTGFEHGVISAGFGQAF